MKRFISLLLSLTLAVGILCAAPFTASAQRRADDSGLSVAAQNTCTVTFDFNGVKPSDRDKKVFKTQTVLSGNKAEKPDDPDENSEWEFLGWCTDKAGKQPYDFDTPVTADLTLYAKWQSRYCTVKFHVNRTEIEDPVYTVLRGAQSPIPLFASNREWIFGGWYTDKTFTDQFYLTDPVTTDLDLYAKWTHKLLATPQITKAVNIEAGVKLTWGKVSGAKKYSVFRKTGDGKFEKLGNTTAVSYADKTAVSGVTYTYTVRCISLDGKYYSSDYDKTGRSITFISRPRFTAFVNTAKGTELSWSKPAGAQKFRVFVKNGKSWKKLADTTATSYTNTQVESGGRYTYTVRCISTDGKQYTSGYNEAGRNYQFIARPALPTLKNTKNGVLISLKQVTGAEKYRIFRKTGSGKWTKIADTTKLSYTDKTAKNGTTYTYTVRCVSKDGKSYTSAYHTAGKAIKCKR